MLWRRPFCYGYVPAAMKKVELASGERAVAML
jgi:hypothetical protein